MIKTINGDVAYEHSLDHAVEFFSKAGSLYANKSPKTQEESALALFQKTWIVDKELSFKLLLWLRDCRGGAGNRSGFRACLTWLANIEPEYVRINMYKIVEVGRWDDLTALYNTPCEAAVMGLWMSAILSGDGLACKWADRKDKKLIKQYKSLLVGKEKNNAAKLFRKFLAEHTKVVESQMCKSNWSEINYAHVPSVAMSRYGKAFKKNDEVRFTAFKEKVEKGEEKVHAGALFPHDCVFNALHGDKEIANAQFAALPNYLEGTDKRIMTLCDTSGSMSCPLNDKSKVQRVHASMALSLYFSDRLGKENPFYRKFMQFESETKLCNWDYMTFSEAVNNKIIFNGACGSTNIELAMNSLLTYAKMFKVSPEHMPNTILIASDMQFNEGTHHSGLPVVKACIQRWVEAGYEAPSIIYWNLAGYHGQPDTVMSKDIALVSGFSPSTMEAVLRADKMDPKTIMMKKLEKYKVSLPISI